MIKLGFASAILPDLSLQEVVDFAAAEGFTCVEVMCWPKSKAERRYAGITHIDVTEFDEAAAQKVNEIATGAGVQISGLGYYPNSLTPDADGWNTAMWLTIDGTGNFYTLESYGKNKNHQGVTVDKQTAEFNCDIAHMQGVFVQWPTGTQKR